MPEDEDVPIWPYGIRPQFSRDDRFNGEINAITVEADWEPAPDGSPPIGTVARRMLRKELTTLVRRTHMGTVRQIEYEAIPRGDLVIEVKYPRPGNLGGWHYRMFAGVPKHPDDDRLVWVVAGRKPENQDSDEWWEIQNEQIDTAAKRFKRWLTKRFTGRI